jgi:hypothetical protein
MSFVFCAKAGVASDAAANATAPTKAVRRIKVSIGMLLPVIA